MTTKQWTPPRNWRWMPGMLATNGNRLGAETDAGYYWLTPTGNPTEAEPPEPDLEDPATLGCLLALVREAWDSSRLCTVHSPGIDMRGPWAVWCSGFIPKKACLLNKRFGTEAEALLAALEAAPLSLSRTIDTGEVNDV